MRHNKYSKTLLWILFLAVFIDEIEGLYVTEDVFERANDIMCLFIFDTDTLAKYSWEEISRNYNILQRYDLTLKDMKLLKHDIYPPTPAMRNIKMWPPYSE
jgi:hypothetical protein